MFEQYTPDQMVGIIKFILKKVWDDDKGLLPALKNGVDFYKFVNAQRHLVLMLWSHPQYLKTISMLFYYLPKVATFDAVEASSLVRQFYAESEKHILLGCLDRLYTAEQKLHPMGNDAHYLYGFLAVKLFWSICYRFDAKLVSDYLAHLLVQENVVARDVFIAKWRELVGGMQDETQIIKNVIQNASVEFVDSLLKLAIKHFAFTSSKKIVNLMNNISNSISVDLPSKDIDVYLDFAVDNLPEDFWEKLENGSVAKFKKRIGGLAYLNPNAVNCEVVCKIKIPAKSILYEYETAIQYAPLCKFGQKAIYFLDMIQEIVVSFENFVKKGFGLHISVQNLNVELSKSDTFVHRLPVTKWAVLFSMLGLDAGAVLHDWSNAQPRIPYDSKCLIPEVKTVSTSKESALSDSKKVHLHDDVPQTLRAIAQIESSGGLNFNHAPVNNALHQGTRAIGFWGLMPIQIHEIVKNNPELHQNPDFKIILNLSPIQDANKLSDLLNEKPIIQKHLAKLHWENLHRKFNGDELKMIYAWKNGIAGTKKAHTDGLEFADDPYVQKVLTAKEKLSNTFLSKNDNTQNEQVYPTRFIPFYNDDFKLANAVNVSLKNGQYRLLNSIPAFEVGKLKSQVYVVGDFQNLQTAWVLKFYLDGASDVVYREAAFYDVINKYFSIPSPLPIFYGHVVLSNGQKVGALLIKMLPEKTVTLEYQQIHNPALFWQKLDNWKEKGLLHKISAALFILGSVDAHAKNFMAKDDYLWALDFGNSFSNYLADDNKQVQLSEKHVKIPFILAVYWSHGRSPIINNYNAKQNLVSWLFDLPIASIVETLSDYNLHQEAYGCYNRWLYLISQYSQSLFESTKTAVKGSIDLIINDAWLNYGRV